MIPVPLTIPNNPQLMGVLNALSQNGMAVTTTNTVPTASTVQQGQAVIYDSGTGTARVYMITHLGNLGYITLTL